MAKSTDELHLPPQDLEAERSVLGSMLFHPPCIDEVIQKIKPGDFYAESNRLLFSAFVEMHNAGRALDVVTAANLLQTKGQLVQAGGVAYLNQVMESVPHAAHAEYYAGIVAEAAFRRRLGETAEQLIRLSRDKSKDFESVLQQSMQSLTDLAETRTRGDATDITSVLMGVMQEIESGTVQGRNVGLCDVDEITGGIRGGEVIIIAARPSVGKSALATTLAYIGGQAFRPSLLFSFEMSPLQIGERLLAMESGISTHNLRSGDLTHEQHDKLNRASNQLSSLPIYIKCDPTMTMIDVQGATRTYHRKHSIEMVVIDYLQLISPADRRIPREQQVSEISRACKCLALSLNIPILLLSQLNRQADGRDPKLSDLRESGSIEQDADQVWLLHREEDGPVGEIDLIVAKNRSGKRGRAKLQFNEQTTQFRNHAAAHFDNF